VANKPKSAEISGGPGCRIKDTISRPSKEIIEQFSHFETPDISDIMNRLYTMTTAIHNVVNDKPLIGPAITVKVYPGDNLMVHKTLDLAQPGDIIVVDTGGAKTNAVIGDLIANKARHKKIAGFVIDGLIRDLPGLKEVGLPIYALGVTPIGPLHRGPGEINYPVSCGGIVVNPGDLITADINGVVVVRKEFTQDIVDKALNQQQNLSEYIKDVKQGNFSNEWVDTILQSIDCHTNE